MQTRTLNVVITSDSTTLSRVLSMPSWKRWLWRRVRFMRRWL